MKEMAFEGGGLEEEWVMVFLGPLRVGSQLRRNIRKHSIYNTSRNNDDKRISQITGTGASRDLSHSGPRKLPRPGSMASGPLS
ncbi:hypothetical protein QJS10_CPB17g00109 [Acorus calamus]|uniref:Uncharacterized protein n=1 Tax=Acorus calamus TaxID=4465 RepID=A0AAV9CYC0_ACOCL|nr:hypothetical protein QJS10_CPB17g00109 [Acorus calamus]